MTSMVHVGLLPSAEPQKADAAVQGATPLKISQNQHMLTTQRTVLIWETWSLLDSTKKGTQTVRLSTRNSFQTAPRPGSDVRVRRRRLQAPDPQDATHQTCAPSSRPSPDSKTVQSLYNWQILLSVSSADLRKNVRIQNKSNKIPRWCIPNHKSIIDLEFLQTDLHELHCLSRCCTVELGHLGHRWCFELSFQQEPRVCHGLATRLCYTGTNYSSCSSIWSCQSAFAVCNQKSESNKSACLRLSIFRYLISIQYIYIYIHNFHTYL